MSISMSVAIGKAGVSGGETLTAREKRELKERMSSKFEISVELVPDTYDKYPLKLAEEDIVVEGISVWFRSGSRVYIPRLETCSVAVIPCKKYGQECFFVSHVDTPIYIQNLSATLEGLKKKGYSFQSALRKPVVISTNAPALDMTGKPVIRDALTTMLQTLTSKKPTLYKHSSSAVILLEIVLPKKDESIKVLTDPGVEKKRHISISESVRNSLACEELYNTSRRLYPISSGQHSIFVPGKKDGNNLEKIENKDALTPKKIAVSILGVLLLIFLYQTLFTVSSDSK